MGHINVQLHGYIVCIFAVYMLDCFHVTSVALITIYRQWHEQLLLKRQDRSRCHDCWCSSNIRHQHQQQLHRESMWNSYITNLFIKISIGNWSSCYFQWIRLLLQQHILSQHPHDLARSRYRIVIYSKRQVTHLKPICHTNHYSLRPESIYSVSNYAVKWCNYRFQIRLPS